MKASKLLEQSAEPFDRACVMVREMELEIDLLHSENQRLKGALFFWLPNIPDTENECTERMATDAALLIGYEGEIDDGAEQRGWIALMPNA